MSLKKTKRKIGQFLLKFCVAVFFLCISTQSNAHLLQDSLHLTLQGKMITIEKVFKSVQQQTGFVVFYNNSLLNDQKKVNVDFVGASLREVMNYITKQRGLTFIIKDHFIILQKDRNKDGSEGNKTASGKSIEKKTESKIEFVVRGTVRDIKGDPLQGVSVKLKGTSIGTSTNASGEYSLTVPDGNGILNFSYVGYTEKEIHVNAHSEINVLLEENVSALDQIVVVGYGTQNAKDISGAISVVGEKDFNKGVVQTAADLLQGKVAGLTITTESGDVTAEQTMRLRGVSSLTGSSSPFVVIDGVPGMDLNSVAPQDIKSISILKDASAAAIYGSRSASGVILITTKKGQSGQAKFQYNAYVAADVVANKPEVLSATEWRDYTSQQGIDVSGLDKGGNTDWFNEIMRTGISQNHFLSVSGGTGNGNYRASLNYINRQGIMRDNSLKRYNALFSINQKAFENRLNLSITGGAVQSDFSPSDSYNSSLAYNMLPVYPVLNPDGSWFETMEYGQGNPVHNIKDNKYLHKTNLQYGNLKADLDILPNLTAGLNLFKQRKSDDQSTYEGRTTPNGRGSLGYAYRGNDVWDKDLLELTLNYTKEIGRGKFGVLAGYSYEENNYQSESAQNRNFISDVFGYNNLSAGENLFPTDVNSYQDMSKLISYFGRVNYSLYDKYIFTGTFRRDGSSIFGENNKWGTFPSASIAWRISEESFMDAAGFVNQLKLRIGYGVVGNQDGIGPYNSVALYGRSDEYWDNGQWRNSYRYSQNANPDLQWEQTASFNPGLDYSLFNNRLNGSIDYYIKKTNNLLYTYSVPVPPNLYPTMLANVGDMTNKGIEILVSGEIIKKTDFRWEASLNFAHNKNVVTRLSNDIYSTSSIKTGTVSPRGSSGTTSHIIEEGKEVGTFYGWKSLGLDDEGKYVIQDMNNDGVIDNLDRTYIGHALPKFTYGISNTFSYKNFTFNFFLRGIYGNDVLNNPSLQYGNIQWLPGSNVLKSALTNGIHDAPKFSSYYIEKGSFLRMDNMSLAYNLPALAIPGVEQCKIYVSAQNLFVITDYSGLDPEVTMGGLAPGVEEAAFIPKARTFSLGINLSF